MNIDEIDPSQILNEPPELTREIAVARWRELNILLHSVVLLGDEMEGRKPLLPILRAAATIASCERGRLFQWDEGLGALRPAASLGFTSAAPGGKPAGTGERQAHACLLHRKPILISGPGPVAGDEDPLWEEVRSLGVRSALSVPITHQGMPWGALQVMRDRPFARDEAVLMWLFALVLEGVLPSVIGTRQHREMTSAVDPATGLLAPAHFRRRLSWEIQRSSWLARPITVACIEVTEMLHGRPRGGSMTFSPREASMVLQKSLRQNDSVTCLGGHHFIAALPDTGRGEAEPVATLVREGFLLRAAGTLPVFDVVTGFATFPEDGGTEAQLIRAACAAGRRRQRRVSRSPLAG